MFWIKNMGRYNIVSIKIVICHIIISLPLILCKVNQLVSPPALLCIFYRIR